MTTHDERRTTKPTPELIAEAQRVVPDLDEVRSASIEPEKVLASALHRPRRAADESRSENGAPPDDVEIALGQPVRTAVERTADGARRAIDKIRRDEPTRSSIRRKSSGPRRSSSCSGGPRS